MRDTTIVADPIRNLPGSVTRQISQIDSEGIATGIRAVTELRDGCATLGSARLFCRVEALWEAP